MSLKRCIIFCKWVHVWRSCIIAFFIVKMVNDLWRGNSRREVVVGSCISRGRTTTSGLHTCESGRLWPLRHDRTRPGMRHCSFMNITKTSMPHVTVRLDFFIDIVRPFLAFARTEPAQWSHLKFVQARFKANLSLHRFGVSCTNMMI